MGLPNISRDNYITLVAACVQGRMANPASATDVTNGEWARRQLIKDAMSDIDSILMENASCVIVETES